MKPQNILALRPDNMGDVLMTEPALRALKTSFPDAQLTLLTSSLGKGITPYIPEIDGTIIFDVPWLKNKSEPHPEDVTELIDRLKEKNFDMAIIFNTYSQSALPTATICYLAGIPNIAAYCKENPYGLINHWMPDLEPYDNLLHEVERQYKLVESIGATGDDQKIKISLPLEIVENVKKMCEDKNIDVSKLIIMHPGCSEEKRRFSINAFAETAKALVGKGYHIAVTGAGDEEKELADTLLSKSGSHNITSFVNTIKLGEFIALVSLARLIITNNTGPSHIGAAVQTPVLVLYARTNPQHAPWSVPHKALFFDILPEQKSKSPLLTATYPKDSLPPLTSSSITKAALELLSQGGNSNTKLLW